MDKAKDRCYEVIPRRVPGELLRRGIRKHDLWVAILPGKVRRAGVGWIPARVAGGDGICLCLHPGT